ncbi:MAG TPA: hypothetical protein DDY14_08045 [Chromatiaceae bacterium]|jgi:hypothetical protein|nr:MAG: hypothetical protein N838_02195 [Thiohalocapsa sp. PB-PSB1]QQO53348.1 MAG: hypothetical protein N838_08185 [Thiohalocapsa sp. PB-PSB1]HBG95264.1 hypothetical protein [Chromatiaceae bacterium]HCS92428.1 hypothetical protein [Chromatiaceae bacterium]
MNEKPTDYIYVPVRAELVQEIYRRRDIRGSEVISIANYVNDALEIHLEGTAGHADAWDNDEYIETYWEDREWEEEQKKYGDRDKGYMWKNLFLPNRTKLRMTYKAAVHEAEIRHQQIVFDEQTEFEGKPFSPSSLVSKIAEGTNRNAWRDIYIQRPGDRDWVLADVARNA